MPVQNLHTITAATPALTVAAFNARLREFMTLIEGRRDKPYFDTKGIITIGIGINIDLAGTNRRLVMRTLVNNTEIAMGLTSSQQLAIDAAFLSPSMLTIRGMPQGTTAERVAKDLALQNFLDGVLGTRNFELTPQQVDATFDHKATSEVAAINAVFPTSSLEKLALVSLRFNNPNLIGQGLKGGLGMIDPHDARAEAWYQIRYSHADQLHKRRYIEAALFGLYGKGVAATDVDQAMGIYRMFTRDRLADTKKGTDLFSRTVYRSANDQCVNHRPT